MNRYTLDVRHMSGQEVFPPSVEEWADQGPLYWVMLRFIAGDYETRNITHATSTSVYGWRLEPNEDQVPLYDLYFLYLPWLTKFRPLIEVNPGFLIQGGTDFGAVAISTRVPPFDPLVPPNIPDPLPGDEVLPFP